MPFEGQLDELDDPAHPFHSVVQPLRLDWVRAAVLVVFAMNEQQRPLVFRNLLRMRKR